MRRLALTALVWFLPATAWSAPMRFPGVGIGLSLDLPQATLDEELDYGRDPTTVFVEVPLFLGGLRLEPELGFGMGVSSSELRWVSGADRDAGRVRGDRVVEQRLVLGLSAGPAFRFSDRMRAWVGGRADVSARRTDFDGKRDDRLGFDWSAGAVFGGESFLLERFSLGGEGRLGFHSMDGAVLVPGDDGEASFRRGWSLGFDVLAAARLYFD